MPDEAATALKVTKPTLYEMVRAGQFDTRHVVWAGNQARIHRDAIYPPSIAAVPEPLCPVSVRRLFAEITDRMAEIEALIGGQEVIPAHVSPIRRRA
jgi:excisionase family DNA binding protein